ncbi:unnamed protein product [Bursaphelenchus xylophilus]|uniref:(pine wood nematode) hypothetical protein n=1 Tax=Bursaphelenchus xylophilus TaxID=6326 RepID=A0A1I7RXK3_BURXY|nr:unnamed protein product [Bursaphelenchus xylophilus]CAG9126511.1 unnamed protein product [Bursaphelenchus xylophilus]
MKTTLVVVSLSLLLHLAESKGGGDDDGKGGGAARGEGGESGSAGRGVGGHAGRGVSSIHVFGGTIFIFSGAADRHQAVETCVNQTMADLAAQNDTAITEVQNAEEEARQECEEAMSGAVVGESLLVGFLIFFFIGFAVYCGLRCYFSNCCRRRKRPESAYHLGSFNEGRIATTNGAKNPL